MKEIAHILFVTNNNFGNHIYNKLYAIKFDAIVICSLKNETRSALLQKVKRHNVYLHFEMQGENSY